MTSPSEKELVALWPDAGRMADLGRTATYAAAARGEIPTIKIGRLIKVPLRRWRRMLHEGAVGRGSGGGVR